MGGFLLILMIFVDGSASLSESSTGWILAPTVLLQQWNSDGYSWVLMEFNGGG